ncbi:MAG TPA: periplasmic heavy metal sensor [Candidatus Acidoferrum sp.]|nr:periplasmic heavy metal sensor [Candidatus Acidoferrum sp.]
MKRAATVVALTVMIGIVGSGAADAQHGAAHAGAEAVPHHALVQTYEKALEQNLAEGRGFGMAFAADQNGYPGPLHVLELKDRLKLTADQEARMQAMLAAMFAESRPKSARLLESEAKLRQLFTRGQADEAAVRTAVAEVEKIRTEVRLVHLLTHLKTREVLSEEQRRLYHDARWGEHGSMRAPGPQGGHGSMK